MGSSETIDLSIDNPFAASSASVEEQLIYELLFTTDDGQSVDIPAQITSTSLQSVSVSLS